MKTILILGRNSRSTRLMLSVLKSNGYTVEYIEERRDDNGQFVKKRIKRFGFFKVFSQLVFQLFSKLQVKSSKVQDRLCFIESELVDCLSVSDFEPLHVFSNVNCSMSLEAINEINPDCIILSGTRILSAEFLTSVNCPILNIHAGVTPAYRGVHGGYWALASQEIERFGSTIHLVDEGIDTGAVIAHAIIKPTVKDNFSTYPLLQMSAALKKLPAILESISKEQLETFKPDIPSAIWSHPTIWQYLFYRFKYGVK